MKVKSGISRLTIPELVQVCAKIVETMAGNANFANPVPDLPTVGKAVTALTNSYKASLDGSHLQNALKNRRVEK